MTPSADWQYPEWRSETTEPGPVSSAASSVWRRRSRWWSSWCWSLGTWVWWVWPRGQGSALSWGVWSPTPGLHQCSPGAWILTWEHWTPVKCPGWWSTMMITWSLSVRWSPSLLISATAVMSTSRAMLSKLIMMSSQLARKVLNYKCYQTILQHFMCGSVTPWQESPSSSSPSSASSSLSCCCCSSWWGGIRGGVCHVWPRCTPAPWRLSQHQTTSQPSPGQSMWVILTSSMILILTPSPWEWSETVTSVLLQPTLTPAYTPYTLLHHPYPEPTLCSSVSTNASVKTLWEVAPDTEDVIFTISSTSTLFISYNFSTSLQLCFNSNNIIVWGFNPNQISTPSLLLLMNLQLLSQ